MAVEIISLGRLMKEKSWIPLSVQLRSGVKPPLLGSVPQEDDFVYQFILAGKSVVLYGSARLQFNLFEFLLTHDPQENFNFSGKVFIDLVVYLCKKTSVKK